MSEVTAHDMSRFWRILTTNSGGRVTGDWIARRDKSDKVRLEPLDVRVYADDQHTWAQVVKLGDFGASVTAGVVDLDVKEIRAQVRDICEDAWEDLTAVLVAVAAKMLEITTESGA